MDSGWAVLAVQVHIGAAVAPGGFDLSCIQAHLFDNCTWNFFGEPLSQFHLLTLEKSLIPANYQATVTGSRGPRDPVWFTEASFWELS